MSETGHGGSGDSGHHGSSHYIKIWAVLLVLLIVSICGPMAGIRTITLITAFGIALVKAYIVASEFMHLKFERKWVSYILIGMLGLMSVFFFGVAPDVMKQDGQNWVKNGEVVEGSALASGSPVHKMSSKVAASTLKDPWVSTPDLVAHGKTLFAQNCVICHGAEGKGNGIGGAALNPKPRNFTSATDKWVNGRTVVGVYKTLKEGIKGSGMASFEALPADDRWALLHFVLSLGPTQVRTPSSSELAKAGISANAEAALPSLPVEFIINRMATDARMSTDAAH